MLDPEAKARLREQLEKVHEWPSLYMFKLIFEPDAERLQRVLALFPEEASITRRYSGSGKYLSITAKEVMVSADEVLGRYDAAAGIAGVIVI